MSSRSTSPKRRRPKRRPDSISRLGSALQVFGWLLVLWGAASLSIFAFSFLASIGGPYTSTDVPPAGAAAASFIMAAFGTVPGLLLVGTGSVLKRVSADS